VLHRHLPRLNVAVAVQRHARLCSLSDLLPRHHERTLRWRRAALHCLPLAAFVVCCAVLCVAEVGWVLRWRHCCSKAALTFNG
jgi:hypothetical protein